MTPRFVFRAQAQAHLREAQLWYANQAVGLELEFAHSVDGAASSPEAWRMESATLTCFP